MDHPRATVIKNHAKDLVSSDFVGMCKTHAITASDTAKSLKRGTVQLQHGISSFHMHVRRILHAITSKTHGQH
jgi:hypothetical protein